MEQSGEADRTAHARRAVSPSVSLSRLLNGPVPAEIVVKPKPFVIVVCPIDIL